jgi:hypothetical protein
MQDEALQENGMQFGACGKPQDETILAKVRMLEEELLIETLKPFNGEPW